MDGVRYVSVKCKYCNGTGKMKRVGLFTIEYPYCKVCKGSGSVFAPDNPRTCADCGGSGKIVVRIDPITGSKKIRPCNICEGTGYAHGRRP